MRLQEQLRARTKSYASAIVRLCAALPKGRKEVEVLGHQLLRFGTSAATQEARIFDGDNRFAH